MTDFLEEYKEQGDPLCYDICKYCGNNDGSTTLHDFGICLKCIKKFEEQIPPEIKVSLARVLLWRSWIHRPGSFKKL